MIWQNYKSFEEGNYLKTTITKMLCLYYKQSKKKFAWNYLVYVCKLMSYIAFSYQQIEYGMILKKT